MKHMDRGLERLTARKKIYLRSKQNRVRHVCDDQAGASRGAV